MPLALVYSAKKKSNRKMRFRSVYTTDPSLRQKFTYSIQPRHSKVEIYRYNFLSYFSDIKNG